jgi:hypothetical protein
MRDETEDRDVDALLVRLHRRRPHEIGGGGVRIRCGATPSGEVISPAVLFRLRDPNPVAREIGS